MNHWSLMSALFCLLWLAAVATGLLELAGLRTEVKTAEVKLLRYVGVP